MAGQLDRRQMLQRHYYVYYVRALLFFFFSFPLSGLSHALRRRRRRHVSKYTVYYP